VLAKTDARQVSRHYGSDTPLCGIGDGFSGAQLDQASALASSTGRYVLHGHHCHSRQGAGSRASLLSAVEGHPEPLHVGDKMVLPMPQMAFPHAALTPGQVASLSRHIRGEPGMGFFFILIIASLYATTHFLVWAISRLGNLE